MARRSFLRKFLRFAVPDRDAARGGRLSPCISTSVSAASSKAGASRCRRAFSPVRSSCTSACASPQADVVDELRRSATGTLRVPRANRAGMSTKKTGSTIALRPFVFWDGAQPAQQRAASPSTAARYRCCAMSPARTLPLARVEPLTIGGIYPPGNEDRGAGAPGDVPQHLVAALIAVEDRSFYKHPASIRAAWRARCAACSPTGCRAAARSLSSW